MMRNDWKNGIMGVVVGDALGCPVQFESRAQVAKHPVTGMRGHGTFNLPAGSWTDDSSLTLALMASIRKTADIDYTDIMDNFVKWLDDGDFTPYGYAYDIGRGCMQAIQRYKWNHNPLMSGGDTVTNNGNGSLMRIMPACLYCYKSGLADRDAVDIVHNVSGLTHAHIRAKIACGLYYFMVKAILNGNGPLTDRMQKRLDLGFAFYEGFLTDRSELNFYSRLRDLKQFAEVPAGEIKSSGYVVDTIEAAVWCLITTDAFDAALLKAVNLGEDTDTVGAIAGGLAGLFYGYDSIPADWLKEIKSRDWIEEMLG